MRIAGERSRSPRDMFFFGMIQNGARGLEGIMGPPAITEGEDEEIDDLAQYGVDWEDMEDPQLLAHHDEFNNEDDEEADPFFNRGPGQLSHVEIEEPLCPFSPEQVQMLDHQLALFPQFHSRNMLSRRAVWVHALALCREIEILPP